MMDDDTIRCSNQTFSSSILNYLLYTNNLSVNTMKEMLLDKLSPFSSTNLNADICIYIFVHVVLMLGAVYVLSWIYEVLFVPINRIRLLGDIGYHGDKLRKRNKKETANLVRKRRKVGEYVPPVYPNGWFQLMDSLELKNGQVREVSALGEHFAVYRATSGKAFVLNAYCPHMGSNLAVGGVVKGDCLQCPFHGWVFEGEEGNCVEIPYATKIPKNAKTKAWECREMNGGIYIWYHCNNIKPEWFIPEIKEISSNRFSYRGRVEHHVNTHIQDIPENGSDLAHLGFLHIPSVFSGSDLATIHTSYWNVVKHIFKVEAEGSQASSKHISKFLLQHYLLFFNRWKALNLDFNVFQIGPGTVHLHFTSSFGEGIFVQTLTPVEPFHLVLVHRLYTSWSIPTWVGRIFLELEAIQVDRDVMVWNNKMYVAKPLLLKEDQLIATYRRWFSQFYCDNSPTLESLQDSSTMLDW